MQEISLHALGKNEHDLCKIPVFWLHSYRLVTLTEEVILVHTIIRLSVACLLPSLS